MGYPARLQRLAPRAIAGIARASWPGAVAVVSLLALGLVLPAGVMATIRNALVYIDLAIPWSILYSLGYPSFATAAFYGIGAYVMTYSILYGLGVPAGLALSALLALAVALAIGYVTLRLAGLFFFFSTLAILEAIRQVMNYTEINLTGHIGKIIPVAVSDAHSLAYLAVLGLVNILIYSYLTATRHRVYIAAVRRDRILASSFGINPHKYSMAIFAISSAMQSICGAVSALYLLYISPDSAFNPFTSLLTLVIGLLGGYSNVAGPIISSVAIVFLYEYASRIAEHLNVALIGAIVIAVTLYLRTNISEILDRYIGRRSPERGL